jgi:hypothetical protein
MRYSPPAAGDSDAYEASPEIGGPPATVYERIGPSVVPAPAGARAKRVDSPATANKARRRRGG